VIKGLDVLVGDWNVESKKYPEGRGRTSVRPSDDGEFIRLESVLEDPRFPRSTMLIGGDDDSDQYAVLYYDSRDVRRVYHMSVTGHEWRMWRHAPEFNQRFVGKISKDGRVIAAQWEMSKDGDNWEVDFDLTYTKTG
jgi:hypothetical protein